MGLIQRLGGRKFLMAFAVIAAAMYLEISTQRGLSPTMAGFLVAMVGTFSAVNYASSVKLTPGRNSGPDDDLHEKVDNVSMMLQKGAANPESLQMLLTTLGTMQADIAQVKHTTGQVGQAVIALGQRRN